MKLRFQPSLLITDHCFLSPFAWISLRRSPITAYLCRYGPFQSTRRRVFGLRELWGGGGGDLHQRTPTRTQLSRATRLLLLATGDRRPATGLVPYFAAVSVCGFSGNFTSSAPVRSFSVLRTTSRIKAAPGGTCNSWVA